WQVQYASYLQSDAWREKREMVFARSGGLCEGCRLKRAVQVHHLTYEHLGNELLWELAAVCLDCHNMVHGDEISSGYLLGNRRAAAELSSGPLLHDMPKVFASTKQGTSEKQVPRNN